VELIRCDTAVAGGGLAGMYSALLAARRGDRVVLLERRRRLGGSVFSLSSPLGPADNSVHLFTGAFRHCLDLLDQLGTRTALRRMRPGYVILDQGRRGCLRVPATGEGGHRVLHRMVTAPLCFLASDLWSFRSRLRFIGLVKRMERLQARAGESASAWLERFGPRAPEHGRFWREWALSVFNGPLEEVDAGLFARTALRFFGDPGASQPLLAEIPLDELLVEPLEALLRGHGVRLLKGCSLRACRRSGSQVLAWDFPGGRIEAQRYVYAAPPDALRRIEGLADLLPGFPGRATGRTIANLLAQVESPGEAGERPLGFFGEPFQWLFPAGPGRVVLVGSGLDPGRDAARCSTGALLERGLRLVAEAGLKAAGGTYLLRQSHATWLQTSAFEAARPGSRSPLINLAWAGAWTATGLPLTMESALASALRLDAERGFWSTSPAN